MKVTPTTSGAADLLAMVSKALREAYNLGQRYWQQADSEYISQHKKADDTRAKFLALVEETCAELAAGQATAAQQGAVYAELPAPTASIGTDDAWHEAAMHAFADATHTLRASHGQAPAGDWLWVKLMDFCKKRGFAPANFNDIFEIVDAARAASGLDTAGNRNPVARYEGYRGAPVPPPECETEAEKRAFAFGWFKALESERMKADNKKKDPL